MSRVLFLLLPALVLQAQDSAIPGAVEVRPGVFVLRSAPNEGTCTAIKKQHITHVLDLRRDGEVNLNCESEASRLQEMEIHYIRYAITKAPPAGDFDFIRSFLNELPRGAKVLVHCDNGNRAAAAVCPWLVLDKGMPVEEALKLAKRAGLQFPETEEAVRKYLATKKRA
jgi:protein-tyrosine phosphatase